MENAINEDIKEVKGQPNKKICSVIIPVKKTPNGEIRIFNWLNSSICHALEVIIVQDCTQPSAGKEVRELVASLGTNQIVYTEGNFGNPGSARNAGLLSVTCEWFAFWDADDLPDVESFLRALEEARNCNAQIMIASFNVRSDLDDTKSVTHKISTRTDLLAELSIRPGLWRFAFKSTVFRNFRVLASSMGEDQAYISALSIFNWRIFRSELPTYNYFLGESGHLTNDVSLMGDMKISIKDLEMTIKSQSGISRKLSYFYIAKQTLTCFKRGHFGLKAWAVWRLLSLFVSHPMILLQYITINVKANSEK